ncbi:MAG: hypothetical protein ACHP7B_00575 [Burkholderiales bacterium]
MKSPQWIDAAALEPMQLSPRESRAYAASALATVDVAISNGVRCAFSDPRAAERFAARYRHLRCWHPAQHFYASLDAGARPIFWRGDGTAFRWNGGPLPASSVAFLADAVVTTLCFGSDAQTVTFHAAALAARDGAFALVGASESGKSTTALACALAGYGLYSDEFCRVGSTGVEPFPRAINLRPGGTALLARSAFAAPALRRRLAARANAGWENAGYDDLFGSLAPPAAAPLRHVFRLAGKSERPAVRSSTRYEMLRHIAPHARVEARGGERAVRLLDALTGATCHELILGTPDETVRAIAAVVGEPRGRT